MFVLTMKRIGKIVRILITSMPVLYLTNLLFGDVFIYAGDNILLSLAVCTVSTFLGHCFSIDTNDVGNRISEL